MHVPPCFAQHDPVAIRSFVRKYSFATFTSMTAAGDLIASHLPLLLDGERPRETLVGHLARANRQGDSLEGRPGLAIFTGPHAYISPTWYAEPNTVPTWNYAAVHVHGICRVVHDDQELLRMLQDQVMFYERLMAAPWHFDSQTVFARKLAAQVVGFRMEISHWEAQLKLGQNYAASRRRRTVQALEVQSGEGAREIAGLMRATLADE